MTPLGMRLKELRTLRGWSLRDAQGELGVDRETIAEAERGLRSPFPRTLRKLAEGYGVPVRELLELDALGKEGAPEEGQQMIDREWRRFVRDLLRPEITPEKVLEQAHEIVDTTYPKALKVSGNVAQQQILDDLLSAAYEHFHLAASGKAEAPQVGPSLLDKALGAARRDAQRDAQAIARLGASEGEPQSVSSYEEDKFRAELRTLGFPDEHFEDFVWPLVQLATKTEQLEERLAACEEERRLLEDRV